MVAQTATEKENDSSHTHTRTLVTVGGSNTRRNDIIKAHLTLTFDRAPPDVVRTARYFVTVLPVNTTLEQHAKKTATVVAHKKNPNITKETKKNMAAARKKAANAAAKKGA